MSLAVEPTSSASISGDSNPATEIPFDWYYTFTGVDHDYRIGTFEITNAQWNRFTAALGVPLAGDPASAYDASGYWTGDNVPVNNVSWYEAAQFVNWLNTSTGHHEAYKFTGTQGTSDYTLAAWTAAEGGTGKDLLRHEDALYYLPNEDEWVKAAYWNGTSLQTYATKDGETVFRGNGTDGGGTTPSTGTLAPMGRRKARGTSAAAARNSTGPTT